MPQANANVARLIEFFATEGEHNVPRDAVTDRQFLATLLTVRKPEPIPPKIAADLDALLSLEADARGTTEATEIPTLASQGIAHGHAAEQMRLWRGDLTLLRADAIVNAANEGMLGCFIPGHRCIDNVIHAAAGPALRAECAEHIRSQGHLEPTGTATLTRGYHLPASFVIHTVGPIVTGHQPTVSDAVTLASSYRSILDVADAHSGIQSVGFCAISTGEFGYPKDAAAGVAISTIRDWLVEHPNSHLQPVVSAFTAADEEVYLKAISQVLK